MYHRFYTPYEVARHNSPCDCWVSIFHEVYDITDLIKKCRRSEAKPLIEYAGTDISHWFDEETRDVKREMDAESGLYVSVCPQGRFVHVPPPFPSADYDMSFRQPWWQNPRYQSIAEEVGRLTLRPRVIRFKNLLTHQEDTLEVPEEETVGEIRRRYANINGHAAAYGLQSLVRDAFGDWTCRELELSKTLEQNGVPNEASVFEEVDLPSDFCTPVIFAQWMDDLTCQ